MDYAGSIPAGGAKYIYVTGLEITKIKHASNPAGSAMKQQETLPTDVIPINIKLALLAFIVAKLSGIAGIISSFAGLRDIAKIFFIIDGISLLLSMIISTIEPKQSEFSQLEIDAVKNLIKNGKLESLIKEVQNQT